MMINAKYLFVLVVGAAISRGLATEKSGECNIQGPHRYECGWLGIDEALCNKRGCCWDSSDPNAKYCFLKQGATTPEGRCPVAPSERKECGYYGITKQECLNKQCCWDDTVPNTKWCFKQPEELPETCRIYNGIYGKCRYTCAPDDKKMYGMGVCKGKICCYKEYPSKLSDIKTTKDKMNQADNE